MGGSSVWTRRRNNCLTLYELAELVGRSVFSVFSMDAVLSAELPPARLRAARYGLASLRLDANLTLALRFGPPPSFAAPARFGLRRGFALSRRAALFRERLDIFFDRLDIFLLDLRDFAALLVLFRRFLAMRVPPG